MRVVFNPLAARGDYTREESAIVSRSLAQAAREEIGRWPGYEATPLRSLDPLADELGIGALLYKDESARLGQGSFKTLGGAYAAGVRLRELGARNDVTLCCATDGNHGRSVAFAAERFGCACAVFMHEHASSRKAAAIAALGARVVWIKGTYDDSVRHAQTAAEKEGWILIADTSVDALDPTTRLVMQGYGVMVLEILEQLRNDPPPTHVFLQGGVGGLAAAVAGVFADIFGASRPRIVVVEPDAAACLLESALRLAPSKVGGDLITAMDMLSTGEASPVAWPILQRRADVFLAIADSAAVGAAERLSVRAGGSGTLNVGVSGIAGMAGLIELLRHQELARLIQLDASARVLVFGTEEGLSTQTAAA
jgi:diaminopropionate ammonia-lyase